MNWFKKIASIEWLVETPSGKFVWQIHLDSFFNVMRRRSPDLNIPEFGDNDFTQNEGNREIFNFWLEEVPEELKEGNELDPSFKQEVRKYLLESQNFDPYEYEEGIEDVENIEDVEDDIPTSEELESWWG